MSKDIKDWLERLVAVGVVILGCLTNQHYITGIGIIYFIAKL